MDNVGWGDFGVYGGTIPTPRIDKLAREGIRFNNYNLEVQCTPSRSVIHTGRHPVRSGTYTVPWPGQGKSGLAPWEYTIAELLSDTGYATALFGKWHLGNTRFWSAPTLTLNQRESPVARQNLFGLQGRGRKQCRAAKRLGANQEP